MIKLFSFLTLITFSVSAYADINASGRGGANTAADVAITDSAGLYDSTTVEGALSENRGCRVIDQISGVPKIYGDDAGETATTAQVLDTITIPANELGANGVLEIRSIWTAQDSTEAAGPTANIETAMWFGVVADAEPLLQKSNILTAGGASGKLADVCTKAWMNGVTTGINTWDSSENFDCLQADINSVPVTYTADMTQEQTVEISATLGNSTDIVRLEHWVAQVCL